MLRPSLFVALGVLALFPLSAPAQTVRFVTNVGDFYLELNPTNDGNLQDHVDNMLAYIGSGRYHRSVINRAPEGFVLQLGGFQSGDFTPETLPLGGFEGIESFDTVTVDADNDGAVDYDTLSNTEGTISLALQSGQPNSGNSSFFVNLTDNSFLDSQGFVPFAEVTDIEDINAIMNLEKADLSGQVGQSGSLAYTDVPLDEEGQFVVIESVAVLDSATLSFIGPIRSVSSVLLDGEELLGGSDDAEGLSASSISDPVSAVGSSLRTSSAPEPAAALLCLLGAAGAAFRRVR